MNVSKLLNKTFLLVSARNYSQYPKNAIYPVCKDRYIQQVIDSGEVNTIKKVPIRAAHVSESNSIFNDYVILKLVNLVMKDGKKELARNEVKKTLAKIKAIQVKQYNATTDVAEKAQVILDPLRILKMAVNNGRPLLKVRPLRRGGSTYQIPVPITDVESLSRSMKWLIEAGNEKEGATTFADKFSAEILDAAHNRGRVVKKKIELHKLCEANRAFAHFRWA